MFIEGAGCKIAAESFGNPNDPAVILVMGATASRLWWPSEFCRRLADAGRFVIRFDHRDTGQSTTVPPGKSDYSIEDLADDVLRVLEGFSVSSAHLVGMSLGGLICQLLTLRNPERFRSLTLIAAEPLGGDRIDAPPIAPVFLSHFQGLESLDWEDQTAVAAFLFETARLSAAPQRGPDETRVRQRIAAEMERANHLASAFNHATVNGDLSRWDLHNIAVPTLVIHGAHDSIVALENGQAIARQIAAANLVVLKDAGHELHTADLETIAAAIVEHTRT